MSLDIRIFPARNAEAVPQLSLQDDGYYGFLHPWLERLREQSGKSLDLYSDVVFTSDDFARLRSLLSEAIAAARARPAQWEVCVGMQSHPVKRRVNRSVRRDRLVAMVDSLRSLIDEAERSGRQIRCIGD